ncbi:MAG: hypothetical protein ACLQUY_15800 [Ktedonobacterales bacterium]
MAAEETRMDMEFRVLSAPDDAAGHHSSDASKAGNFVKAHSSASRCVQVAPGSLSEALVQEVMQIRDVLGPKDLVRVLILEPFSSALGQQLWAAGFAGERWALLRHPYLPTLQRQAGPAYDHVIIADWLSPIIDNQRLPSLVEVGRFDIIVVSELSRIMPREQIAATLQWVASTLLSPYGYLVSGEPGSVTAQVDLETPLLHSELLLAADKRQIEADLSWSLTCWQRRPGDSSRLSGQIREISRADLERRASLRQALAACYQEVFGGDEWAEWMRCLDCYRYYSYSEYLSLSPSGHCVCGTERPLNLYHSPRSILGELYVDLAERAKSRLYVRSGETGNIEAFIWGSLVTAEQLASDLLAYHGEVEQSRLQSSVATFLDRQGIHDPSALVLHIAYVGALKQVRSLSLARSLLTRICQFAVDSHVDAVVLATIPTVNTFALMRGIGMEVVYTYPSLPPQEWTSRLDESGVVLSGTARSLLSQISCSETRLALHIGRSTKRMPVAMRGG